MKNIIEKYREKKWRIKEMTDRHSMFYVLKIGVPSTDNWYIEFLTGKIQTTKRSLNDTEILICWSVNPSQFGSDTIFDLNSMTAS